MEWIDVKDRLPEIKINKNLDLNESEAILGLFKDGEIYKIKMCHWYEDEPNEFTFYFNYDAEPCSPTHWMPLPEPPKH